MARKSDKWEREQIIKLIQKETGKKQPRRYLLKMLDLICMYFVGYENRSKSWLKQEIDRYFE